MRQSDTINELAAALAKAQGEFKNPERNRDAGPLPRSVVPGRWLAGCGMIGCHRDQAA